MGRLLRACVDGTTREALEALRDKLAEAIEVCEPSVIAQVAGQLRSTLVALEALPVQGEASLVDQLAAQRAQRLASAATTGGA